MPHPHPQKPPKGSGLEPQEQQFNLQSSDVRLARMGESAAAWGMVGEVIGNLIGLAVPDILISDAMLGHYCAILFGAASALLARWIFKPNPMRQLDRCLGWAHSM